LAFIVPVARKRRFGFDPSQMRSHHSHVDGYDASSFGHSARIGKIEAITICNWKCSGT